MTAVVAGGWILSSEGEMSKSFALNHLENFDGLCYEDRSFSLWETANYEFTSEPDDFIRSPNRGGRKLFVLVALRQI